MPQRPIRPDDLLKIVFVSDPQFHPDGHEILFSRKHINEKNKYITNLWSASDTGELKQWTQGDAGSSSGRWSPDGHSIAFVSGRNETIPQVFVMSANGGEAQALTKLEEGTISNMKWSPDGKYIAFAYRETHPERTKKAAKAREENGGSTPAWVIDVPWYKLDGDGYFGEQRFAIWTVEVATGAMKKLYGSGPYGTSDFSWSPKSDEIVVSHEMGENPWHKKELPLIFRVKLDGSATQVTGQKGGNKGNVSWSPDGNWIAYTAHPYEQETWGVRNMRIWVVPAAGGDAKCLTLEDDYCFETATLSDTKDAGGSGSLIWSPDSQAIYANAAWHGESQICYVPISEGGVRLLTEGKHGITIGNLSKDGGHIACTYGNATTLNEVAGYDLGEHGPLPKTWTSVNKDFHEEVISVAPTETWVEAADGHKVHVWALAPIGIDNHQRGPAVLEVHGGPHCQYGCTYYNEFQVLAASGLEVVYSNPRGSKGYGEDHCMAIRADWGNKDWVDIEAVTHWMQNQPNIHPGQLGIMGGSYGGYMTNWAVSHSDAYKAAITDRCVSNFTSMGGNSDFVDEKDGYHGKGNWFGSLESISNVWR
ncbi:MAG: S9 family peptidase, partial [Armatimonadetes bacterium]|nr:S9 family peptidase [Armatimonadota bacterium]